MISFNFSSIVINLLLILLISLFAIFVPDLLLMNENLSVLFFIADALIFVVVK